MRIFVTGSIAYDYIMVFPGRFRDHILPDKMHVLSVSFLVDSLTRRRGGTGANIAFNLALLGEKPVLVGTVGEDFAEYRAWLSQAGVDSAACGSFPASTRPPASSTPTCRTTRSRRFIPAPWRRLRPSRRVMSAPPEATWS